MAGGKIWEQIEDDFILRMVALGRTNPEIHAGYVAKFGNRRTQAALRKRRADLASADPMPEADDKVRYAEDDDALHVTVVSVGKIKTIEDLREAAEVDLEVWDEFKADVRNRYAPMKNADGEIVAVEIRYIKIEYRRTAQSRFDLTPAIVKIARPVTRQPGTATGDVSVHFGDKHIPFDSPKNTSILHQILEITDPSVVVDHGDTLDCEAISRFPKDPTDRTTLKDEIELGIKHFGEVSSLVSESCRKVWLEGNHEERKRRIVWDLADKRAYGELITLPHVMAALEWSNLLGLESLGWEDYPYISTGEKKNWIALYDRVICKHGASSSGDVAKKEYEKYGKSGLSGHLHRQQVHSRRDWNGQHQWHTLGMLGEIRDAYVDHANWQAGLMVVQWSPRKDRWAFEPIQIINGECWFRGMHLKG